jgi:hypothetical protein
MSRCDQELCPRWAGDGCVCRVLGEPGRVRSWMMSDFDYRLGEFIERAILSGLLVGLPVATVVVLLWRVLT